MIGLVFALIRLHVSTRTAQYPLFNVRSELNINYLNGFKVI